MLQQLAESMPEEWGEWLRTLNGVFVVLGFVVMVYSAAVTTATALKDTRLPWCRRRSSSSLRP